MSGPPVTIRVLPDILQMNPEQFAQELRDRYQIAVLRRDLDVIDSTSERALTLLLQSLSPQQRSDYENLSYFFVTGASGRRYRIRWGTAGNVDIIAPSGRVGSSLCGLPSTWMPTEDVLLAQKLCLQTNDRAFSRVARHMLTRIDDYGRQVLPKMSRSWRDRLPRFEPFGRVNPMAFNILVILLNVGATAHDLVKHKPALALINGGGVTILILATLVLHLQHRRHIAQIRSIQTQLRTSPWA